MIIVNKDHTEAYNINQRIKLEPHQTYRHVAGKKTKGYGGS